MHLHEGEATLLIRRVLLQLCQARHDNGCLHEVNECVAILEWESSLHQSFFQSPDLTGEIQKIYGYLQLSGKALQEDLVY